MNTLVIEKQTGGYFKFTLNGDTANAITSIQNDLLAVGTQLHFKTGNGANIIKEQFIYPADVTIIASGTFTFTTVAQVWDKLIDIDYFAWLGGGGTGGVDRFDDLLDTFSYTGNAGKAVVVDGSELRLVPITLYNKRLFTELEDTPSSLVPNKMLVVNPAGTAVVLQDQPEQPEQLLNSVGYFDYNDLITQTTPLNAVANVALKLTNDTEGVNTSTDQNPYGVSYVWDYTTNAFNFSELEVGDTIDVRVHVQVTTTSANQRVILSANFGIGSVAEFTNIIYENQFKSAGLHEINFVAPFYMGSTYITDNPAELYLTTDSSATVKVDGWYVRILRKNINIITVDYTVPDATTTVKGIVRLAGDLAGTANSPTVPELANKVPNTRTVSTTSPLLGGGALSSNLTLSIQQANSVDSGFLTYADWTRFDEAHNDRIVSAAVTGTTTKTLTLNQHDGGFIQANWTDNDTAITLGTPSNGLGLADQVLSLGLSSATTIGALSSTDWTTFNSKQGALNGTGFVKVVGTTVSYDNSTYALDSVVVKLTGDQTIAGNKTFTTEVRTKFQNSDAIQVQFLNTSDLTKNLSIGHGSNGNIFSSTGLDFRVGGLTTSALMIADNENATFRANVTANSFINVNASTGIGFNSTNSSTGQGIYSNNTAGGIGIYSNNSSSSGKGFYSSNSGGFGSVGIYSSNLSSGNGIYSNNSSTGYGIYSGNSSTGTGIQSQNSSTGEGIRSNNTAGGTGFFSLNTSTGRGFWSSNTGSYGIYSENAGVGIGIYSQNSSTGQAFYSTNTAGGIGIYSRNQSTGKGLVIDNTTSATGMPFTIQKNGADVVTISDAGAGVFSSTVQASAFKLTGMTAGSGALYWTSDRVTLANYNTNGVVEIEALGGSSIATFGNSIDFTKTVFVSSNLYANGLISRGTPANTLSYLSGSGAIFIRSLADETAYAFQLNTSSGLDLWSTNSGGTSTRRLTLDSSGNLGIGTTTVPNTLSVGMASSTTGKGISLTSSAGIEYARFGVINSTVDNTSYIGSISNNNFAIYANNAERMRITSGGNVGIGTTSPAVRFHSYGGALSVGDESSYSARFSNNSNKGVVIGYDSTNNKGHIGSINPAVAWTDLILNANGGNVGIGTASPAAKLDVHSVIRATNTSSASFQNAALELFTYNGSSVSAGTALFSTNSNFNYGTILSNQTNLYGVRDGGIRIATGVAPIVFSNGNADIDFASERMRITSGGDVSMSDITSVSSRNLGIPLSNAGWVKLCTIHDNSVIKIIGKVNSNNSEETFTIDVNTTYYADQSLISVTRKTYNPLLAEVRVGANSQGVDKIVYARFRASENAPTVNWHLIGSKGVVTINNTLATPSESLFNTLTVTGNNTFCTNRDTIQSGSITANSFITSSDARLKNVISRDGDLVVYNLLDNEKIHYGYIAQDMQDKYPNQVHENEEGYLSLNYIEILVKKVNDLEKEIEILKNK